MATLYLCHVPAGYTYFLFEKKKQQCTLSGTVEDNLSIDVSIENMEWVSQYDNLNSSHELSNLICIGHENK